MVGFLLLISVSAFMNHGLLQIYVDILNADLVLAKLIVLCMLKGTASLENFERSPYLVHILGVLPWPCFMERFNFTMLERNIVRSSSIAIGHLVFFGATSCLMVFKCKEWLDGMEVHPKLFAW